MEWLIIVAGCYLGVRALLVAAVNHSLRQAHRVVGEQLLRDLSKEE